VGALCYWCFGLLSGAGCNKRCSWSLLKLVCHCSCMCVLLNLLALSLL
jgi:hypothetical protein